MSWILFPIGLWLLRFYLFCFCFCFYFRSERKFYSRLTPIFFRSASYPFQLSLSSTSFFKLALCLLWCFFISSLSKNFDPSTANHPHSQKPISGNNVNTVPHQYQHSTPATQSHKSNLHKNAADMFGVPPASSAHHAPFFPPYQFPGGLQLPPLSTTSSSSSPSNLTPFNIGQLMQQAQSQPHHNSPSGAPTPHFAFDPAALYSICFCFYLQLKRVLHAKIVWVFEI